VQLSDNWGDPEGRCFNCGFLGKRLDSDSACLEVTIERRIHGEIWRHDGRDYAVPVCYARQWTLTDEIPSAISASKEAKWDELSAAIKDMLFKERHCPAWILYTEGFSPKEHWEWDRMKNWEVQLHRETVNSSRWQIGIAVITLVLTVIAIYATVRLTTPNPLPVVVVTPIATTQQSTGGIQASPLVPTS
jgi:hypothetical protein